MISWILFILLVILQLVDIYTTDRILDLDGRELNPIMRFLMRKFGRMKALIVSKAIVLTILLFFICSMGGHLLIINGLGVVILWYAYFMYKNIKVLKKLKHEVAY